MRDKESTLPRGYVQLSVNNIPVMEYFFFFLFPPLALVCEPIVLTGLHVFIACCMYSLFSLPDYRVVVFGLTLHKNQRKKKKQVKRRRRKMRSQMNYSKK